MMRISTPVLGASLLLLSSGAASAQESTEPPPSVDGVGFRIGIEDVLKIVVWGEPDLSVTQKVRPDGAITVPLVNDVSVEGATPTEVRTRIAERLAAFIRDPNVTVMVDQINSFRVYFLGEITTQGPIQFYRPTRLLQGIATAGGLTSFAKKEIVVLREEGGVERRIEVDYKRLWSGDPGVENLVLKPGDTVLSK